MNLQIIFLLIVLTNLQRQTKQKTNTKQNKILTCGGSGGGGGSKVIQKSFRFTCNLLTTNNDDA